MTMNMRNSTSALPRSFSSTTIRNASAHITISGSSVCRLGRFTGPMRQVNTESISRFCAKYAARNSTMNIFASSPGWNEKPPMFSHRRLPLISLPITGSIGDSRSSTPTIMSVYL